MSVSAHPIHPNSNLYFNVRSLYTSLIHDYYAHPLENKNPLYCAVMLMEWLFAAKNHTSTPTNHSNSTPQGNSITALASTLASAISHGSHVQHRANIMPEEALQLATLHFTIWTADYVYINVYHLERAYTWFQHFFTQKPSHDVLEDLLTYFYVLQHKGDHQSAFALISNMLNVYDNSHPLYVNLLFYAGCAAKGCGMLEKANVYFFDSSQLGPVKHFTRLEMMTLISRTIEEHNASNGNDNQEGGNDPSTDDNEAYQMVHTHLLQEHLIDLDYDDWLSSMHTWLALGDKCSFHNMHSLVADFVALAITKDANAFSNSKVWLKFAKACRRCGRHSDALLAIQVMGTVCVHDMQECVFVSMYAYVYVCLSISMYRVCCIFT
ncbi:hypothetical protein EON65_25075 [archaeon]|nr:MAG: hypothetical protein EON65_25075 [archaeon]